jgi:uncharacterized protein YbjT (DUF2867 family)
MLTNGRVKVVVFGATGMVGQGVVRECVGDARVESVLAVGRTATGLRDAKLRDRVVADLFDVASYAADLEGPEGLDACFFCLGVSSAGMSEAAYRHLTYDLTLAIARALAERNPRMTFVYVSGEGTDMTGRSRWMWARVKGETEKALLALPFAHAYMFRPGFIQPGRGIAAKTPLYRWIYALLGPLFPLLKALFPNQVTTTACVGRAMLAVAAGGAHEKVLATRDINAAGA